MLKTDQEILDSWGKSPDEAFRWLYDRYSGVLLRYVYRFTGNQEQAEEILQDVFAQVLKADLRNQEASLLKAWLFTIAKNKSLNFERKKKRETPSDLKVQSAIDPQSLEGNIADLQILAQMRRLQSHLPADLAKTWQLRQEGFDYQAIADQLQIPLGTVKSRFSRLVEFFKKEFGVENNP